MRNLPVGAPFDPLMRFFPDLLPVAFLEAAGRGARVVAGAAAYCRKDAQGNLLVIIMNQGRFTAAPSTTRVVYEGGQAVDRPTPALAQDQSVILTFPDPFLFVNAPVANFQIIADVFNQVTERNEMNNSVMGTCF